MLIDETHFGAKSHEYGKVLKDEKFNTKEIKSELKLNDNSLDDLEITNKVFNAENSHSSFWNALSHFDE